MKRPGLALIVAALLASACGGAANGAADSPDDPVSAPAVPDSGGRAKAQLREPEEGLVDTYARIFDRHKAEGRKVTLLYWSGIDECVGLDHVEIKERARKVVLTIFETLLIVMLVVFVFLGSLRSVMIPITVSGFTSYWRLR